MLRAALFVVGAVSIADDFGLGDFLGGEPAKQISPRAETPDDPFTIIFLADSEARMRDNTDEEISEYIANIISYKNLREEFFEYEGGVHRIHPELVILAGDISKDRDTKVDNDYHLWEPLEENGIIFIAGWGNHDWEAESWYSFEGDGSNRQVTEFCRQSYRRAAEQSSYFGYQEFGPSDTRGPITFLASFRGVQIVNFNSFLYQPSYHYDFSSAEGDACWWRNSILGWGGCQKFSSAEPQISALENSLDSNASTPTLFVQHYPFETSDDWWDDYEASGASIAEMKDRLKNLIGRYDSSVFLSGHNHGFAEYTQFSASGVSFTEHVAPYFGGSNGVDTDIGGGFIAILVSRTKGILETKHIETPLLNYVPPTTSTTTNTGVITSTYTTTISVTYSTTLSTYTSGTITATDIAPTGTTTSYSTTLSTSTSGTVTATDITSTGTSTSYSITVSTSTEITSTLLGGSTSAGQSYFLGSSTNREMSASRSSNLFARSTFVWLLLVIGFQSFS